MASRILRIPTATSVSAPASMRPSGANPAIDVSAPFEGAQALAEGAMQAATGIGNAGAKILDQQKASDLAAADTAWLKGSLDIGNRFEQDGEFTTFAQRAEVDTTKLKSEAANLIKDPTTRQAWLDAVELKRLSLVDAIKDRGVALSQSADRAKLTTSIDTLSTLYSDPATPQVTRDAAKNNIAAQIAVAEHTGLITPEQGAALRKAGIDNASENLAINRAKADILGNPQGVASRLGVSSVSDNGTGVLGAIEGANGGKLPAIDFSLAKLTADMLDDANFPDDPKLAKAYLADPEKAAEYGRAAAAMLNDRYSGDLTAVVVALDPQGGTVLADKWVSSKHDESVLPADVRARYRATMTGYKAGVSGERLPISAAPNVDLAGTDAGVLDRFETLQSRFGQVLPLISAHRDPAHNAKVGGADKSQHIGGRALDVDVSSLSEERKVQFIEMASAMGFTGIGVYANSIHLDTGDLRAWGPDYHKGSVPTWAKDAIAAHLDGTVKDVPLAYTQVDPRYAAIPFDKRLVLFGEATRAAKENNVTLQASLETIAANAPAAIANTGTYDGDMPTAASFVQAYGAADGVSKYKAFQAAIDTSRTIYGFRAMPNDEIMAQVMAATPVGSGNDAALESKRYDAISAAAEQVIKAREADPAGYVINAFPKVGEAFQAASEKGAAPDAYAKALTAMEAAQRGLGIEDVQLLPKQQAAQAATRFNDTSLPAADRIQSVAGLLLGTTDEKQQFAVFRQLVDAGVPAYSQGAVAAMVRGDVGAAQNLLRAVMIDPEKLAGSITAKSSEIDAAIQDRIFDDGEIGDVVYGVRNGSTDNYQRMAADASLINRDVRLHLIDGSAGGDLNRAVDLTIRDMFGDVQVVKAPGVKITLPTATDAEPLLRGFTGVKPKVADALRADMQNGMVQIIGGGDVGMGDIVSMGIDNAVSRVMEEGYFINAAGEHYQFFNPFTGTVVAGKDGAAMLFSKADVMAAAAKVPQLARPFPGMGGR